MENRGLHPTAYEIEEGQDYVPYVRSETMSEFTLKAVLSGMVLGVMFGAANAYLGLVAGLTISTSIPVAVLTVVVFRVLSNSGVKSSILESNISQTVGSASSSIASGVLFTVPALYLWGLNPPLGQLTVLALVGGVVGILFMIPLRSYLIKSEHGKLPYPEGLACAEVLVASERGASQASNLFWGLGVGALFKFITDGIQVVGKTFQFQVGKVFDFTNLSSNLVGVNKMVVAAKVSPALMGVGYILGPRVASVMVGGAALSSFVIIPLIAWWGNEFTAPYAPETEKLISEMAPEDLWNRYIRYIGAGAVATAGIITLIRSIPTMLESFRLGLSRLGVKGDGEETPRRDQDLPLFVVGVGVTVVIGLLVFVRGSLGSLDVLWMKALAGVLIVIFAFFFVTVASRIVGLVGSTSNPVSGMTIATLLGTSFIIYLIFPTDTESTALAAKATALMVGMCVCVAASISGDTSQDLKTGFLLGATPKWQQVGELLGAISSAVFVCMAIQALNASLTIGSKDLPAPQGQLMKLVIDGVIEQNLPWGWIFIGVGLAFAAFLLRLPALAFAVGVYLPLSTMAPVFLGGMVRYFLTRKQPKAVADHRREQGILFGSGLVGGEGLLGVGIALVVLVSGQKLIPLTLDLGFPDWWDPTKSFLGLVCLVGIIGWLACRGKPRPTDTGDVNNQLSPEEAKEAIQDLTGKPPLSDDDKTRIQRP